MKTLTAQRLKRQVEQELKNRREMLDHLLMEARAEAEKLSTLLTVPVETETPQRAFEEYREDDEDSYWEEGFIER